MFCARNKTRGLSDLLPSLRSSGFYALFFVIGYAGILFSADLLIRDSIADNEREIVSERLIEYRAWFAEGRLGELRSRFQEQSIRSEELLFVRIAGPTTNAVLFSSPRGEDLIDPAALNRLSRSGNPVVATLETRNPRNVWTIASAPAAGGHLIQAGRISTKSFEPANRFRRFFTWATIPIVLLALAGGGWLNYLAMKPVRDLTATAADIVETGNLDRRVAVTDDSGGLARMAILFNEMLDRNQSLIRSMKDSLDNTAHDLRTPLARIRASAESALSGESGREDMREALADCLEESERVGTMLDTLMDIAEAETGVLVLHRKNVDLSALIRQVVELYDLVASEQNMKIEADLPDSLTLEADPSRLQQIVANLVDNAIKYSGAGGVIHLSAHRDADEVTMAVRDEGMGISEEDLPRIWERLYRADQSRSRAGLGLGLSLVEAFVTAHGGRVSVESAPGKGSTFTVRLPAVPTTNGD